MELLKFTEEHDIQNIFWIDDDNADSTKTDVGYLASRLVSIVDAADQGVKKRLCGVLIKEYGDNNKKQIRTFTNNTTIESVEAVLEMADDPKKFISTCFDVCDGVPKSALVEKIDEFLSPSSNYRKLSFNEWNLEKASVINLLKKTSKVLILLDLVNQKEPGIDKNAGIEVIRDLEQEIDKQNTIIIVFSSLIGTEQEAVKAREFTNLYCNKSAIPVFMLSKHRDFTQDISAVFAEIFKRYALCHAYNNLKSSLIDIYQSSISRTFSELKLMTAEELVFRISKNSEIEGVSEIESMLRVIDVGARSELQQKIADSNKLLKLIVTARKLDSSITHSKIDIDDENIRNLIRFEYYENIKAVNKLRSVVSVGDVFKYSNKGRSTYYLLIGNACFSMLRKDGERKDMNALLFPVITSKPKHEAYEELVNFGEYIKQCDEKFYVNFCDPFVVRYALLDTCWTNARGKGRLLSERELINLSNEPYIGSQRLRLRTMLEEQHKETGRSKEKIKTIEKLYSSFTRVARLNHNYSLIMTNKYSKLLGQLPIPTKLLN